MHRFGGDALQAANGIAALRIILDGTPCEDVTAVVEACGVEAIIASMQRHPGSAMVQVSGSGTLACIARSSAGARQRILEAGGLHEVGAAVARCREDAEGDDGVVCKWRFCAECLRGIAGKPSDPRNKQAIDVAVASGVERDLFDALAS